MADDGLKDATRPAVAVQARGCAFLRRTIIGAVRMAPTENSKVAMLGENLLGAASLNGEGAAFHGVEAATGDRLQPEYRSATPAMLEAACTLANQAFDPYRDTDIETRARFLERIVENLSANAAEIVARAVLESGLPLPRIEGELVRTSNQLRLFASVLREGRFIDPQVDLALPDRKPAPRADIRRRNVPLGPVVVFGASNFPLAFSVAGGDTASALAAGCPVIVKAHSAHPGTSELVGRAIQKAVADTGLPDGVFSLLFDAGISVGQALCGHPAIKAVGFTGSRRAGLALLKIAQDRPEPIPVYAEMSSVNPVLLLPSALATRGVAIAQSYVAALTLGAGQFCTSPGVVFVVDGPGIDAFLQSAAEALAQAPAQVMLTDGISQAYRAGVAALAGNPAVTPLSTGVAGSERQDQAKLFSTTADAFLRDSSLQAEVFGATSLVVRCPDIETMSALLEEMEGQLTISVHADDADHALARKLIPSLERRSGRIVFNAFGAGVEVGHAMVHGGPYPATSDSRVTSVGSLAIQRFLRPVCYQDFPSELLPAALR